MPDSCCAVGCSNRRSKTSKLHFYRIPFGTDENSLDLRRKWLNALRRDKWADEQIDNARVCSAHFLTGSYIFAALQEYYIVLLFMF